MTLKVTPCFEKKLKSLQMKKHNISRFSGLKKKIQSRLFNKRLRKSGKAITKNANLILEELSISGLQGEATLRNDYFIELHEFKVSPHLIFNESVLSILGLSLDRFSFQEVLSRYQYLVNLSKDFEVQESPENIEQTKKLATEFVEQLSIESIPNAYYANEHRSQLLKILKRKNPDLTFNSEQEVQDWFEAQDISNQSFEMDWAFAGVLAREDFYVTLFEKFILANFNK
jgi:hypothetical protein